MGRIRAVSKGAGLALGLLLAGSAWAADDKETGWFNTTQFSWVVTTGNAETSTIGFKNQLRRSWTEAQFSLRLEALRAETDEVTKIPVGTAGSFNVVEQTTTTTNAERYLIEGRYDREITERFFWNAGAGWDRNRPTGVENRYQAFAGVGNVWKDEDRLKFDTSYNVSYTDREDVVPDPRRDESFAGVRFNSNLWYEFTENAEYRNEFVANASLRESDDWYVDWINAVSVSINERVALGVSLQLLYQNLPARELLELQNPLGTPTGVFVPVEKDELDSIFSTSLIVKF